MTVPPVADHRAADRAVRPPLVALETTLLLHGVPRAGALALAVELDAIVRSEGAAPALVGVLRGRAIVGMSRGELESLLALPPAESPKLNAATLGLALASGGSGATTVSTTLELAAGAGVRVFATGGLGGVHKGFAARPDVSADLAALARYPVAVVTAGCKSILDVVATRELLETLGVPVVGWRTERFPAFYSRDGGVPVDARFDDEARLGAYLAAELLRPGRLARGIVVANPIGAGDEIPEGTFAAWLAEAEARAAAGPAPASGRDITPRVLAALHEVSGGATLRANIALVKQNARLAARLAAAMARADHAAG